jgi:hypothetical protein
MKRQAHRDRQRVDSQLVGSDLVEVWRRRIIICRSHDFIADKMHLFEPGSTYEIEYMETVSSGITYRNVKSATAVVAPAAPADPDGNKLNAFVMESTSD